MADEIVKAKIIFEDGTSTPSDIKGGPGGDKETKKVVNELKGLNRNFGKFISGSLTGLIGGAVGGAGNIAALIGAAFQSPLVIAGIGAAISAGLISNAVTRPQDELPGSGGAEEIPDVVIPVQDSEEYKDNVVESLENFEQTPKVISDIELETGKVTKSLSLQNDEEQKIIDNLNITKFLNEDIQEGIDKQLQTFFKQNDALRERNKLLGEGGFGVTLGDIPITPPTGNARNEGDPIFVGGARKNEKGEIILFDKPSGKQ